MIDRAKFIKLMGMTTSSNDGEVLNAVRLANKMLKENNTNWSEFVSGIKQQTPRPPPQPQGRGFSPKDQVGLVTDPDITRMLASLLRDVKGGFRDFVESVNDDWHSHGHLTKPQYEAILRAYERLQ